MMSTYVYACKLLCAELYTSRIHRVQIMLA